MQNADKKIETDSAELRFTLQDERMEHLATKEDLAELRHHTDTSILDLRNHVDRSIADLRLHVDKSILELRLYVDASNAELRAQIKSLETKVARWLLAHIVVEVTVLLGILAVVLERLPPA